MWASWDASNKIIWRHAISTLRTILSKSWSDMIFKYLKIHWKVKLFFIVFFLCTSDQFEVDHSGVLAVWFDALRCASSSHITCLRSLLQILISTSFCCLRRYCPPLRICIVSNEEYYCITMEIIQVICVTTPISSNRKIFEGFILYSRALYLRQDIHSWMYDFESPGYHSLEVAVFLLLFAWRYHQ